MAEVAANDPRRIAFIALCDSGHTHRADGPHGFQPESAAVDAEVVAVTANELESLIDLDEGRAQNAAIDGHWQAVMLAGALKVVPMHFEFLSYESPTYFGMLVAVWSP